jgi:hypothetical protein
MNKKELLEKLKNYPEDMEVRIINASIENDEYCPTFEITSISKTSASGMDESEEEQECILIEFNNGTYLADKFNINRDEDEWFH